MPVAVCANLPYYITSPIIMKLLEDRLPIQNITVMVQKEAAERLAALPGTRASGAVSLRGALLRPAQNDVHRPGRQFLPGPQG